MKKKLLSALCLILCVLLGIGTGYIAGHAGLCRSILGPVLQQWGFEQKDRITDAEAACALAEAYYRENFDPDGKDPRLADKAIHIPPVGGWLVTLLPEGYVLASEKSFSTLTGSWNGSTYYVDILAEDGAVLGISFR